ncbi:hypothetical protein E6C27_scaffold205G001210 [Cucumis melo var. makuwa]|uniref:Uncharacterized protein n=1 Tax=Cucumis melo var. makuwa TaxID=1194695 RepID=A0A5A7V6T7_CUCMM|nr:hypothetical protein E6C27_scaffold205G001210 [Cucumis melo var. makuwa]
MVVIQQLQDSWLEISEAIQSTISSKCTINPFLDDKALSMFMTPLMPNPYTTLKTGHCLEISIFDSWMQLSLLHIFAIKRHLMERVKFQAAGLKIQSNSYGLILAHLLLPVELAGLEITVSICGVNVMTTPNRLAAVVAETHVVEFDFSADLPNMVANLGHSRDKNPIQHPIPSTRPSTSYIPSRSTATPISLRDMASILLQHGLCVMAIPSLPPPKVKKPYTANSKRNKL